MLHEVESAEAASVICSGDGRHAGPDGVGERHALAAPPERGKHAGGRLERAVQRRQNAAAVNE